MLNKYFFEITIGIAICTYNTCGITLENVMVKIV